MNKFILILMILFNSCGAGDGGTTTGNPLVVNMEIGSYNNSVADRVMELFIPKAYASLSDLKFCFKRMRFKSASDDASASNIDLELGEVVIKQEGTSLGKVEVSPGTYKRIEFDLEKNCDGTTKPSVYIANGNGNHQTDDTITIKFEGEFDPSDGDLSFAIQNIIDQVKNYQASDGEIKDQLEAVSGSY